MTQTNDLYKMLEEFEDKCKDILGDKYKTDIKLRLRLISEEFFEVVCASDDGVPEKLLKELCDLVYVCVGTAVVFGWDFNKAFKRVHESNMSKFIMPVFENGKLKKGSHYKGCNLSDLV